MNPQAFVPTLKGYSGPCYPDGIDILNTLLSSKNWHIFDMKRIARNTKAFTADAGERSGIKTDDNYTWFFAMVYRVGPFGICGEVVVLFPWKDMDEVGHTYLTRSIAMYTAGIAQWWLPELVKELIIAFRLRA